MLRCNDVFMLRANITSLGMDQRKVNMLAREFAEPKNNIMGVLVRLCRYWELFIRMPFHLVLLFHRHASSRAILFFGTKQDYITDEKSGKIRKPTMLSHHMLGALDGDDKMSKSKPDSAIFMEDSEKEVIRKIKVRF